MQHLSLFDLSGKTAIITGGGQGLGKQMATALAKAGANIVLCSRNMDICEETSKELSNNFGVKCLALKCDVTKKEEILSVVEETMQTFGSIDILINNSGTSWFAPFMDMPEDKWDYVMEVNMKGTFLFSQAVAKVMIAQGSGKIVNIASVLGLGGVQPKILNTIAYNSSKGAVITFTKDLAVKLAKHHIQVNAVAPGFFPTKITRSVLEKNQMPLQAHIPAGRFGNDTDLMGPIIFLSSKASDYMTGHILIVDGGITASI
ncbi:SDR family oxidoreductase [Bacillus massilinigeriensis]|uniref:SDR family oxidoreductase n=1 Tax=Bacillus massilionigeriensis TaxID=1805475 RepID=UPI00096B5943|nr:SDR family oxidoreductase [Bacillus massilionigeriensis]